MNFLLLDLKFVVIHTILNENLYMHVANTKRHVKKNMIRKFFNKGHFMVSALSVSDPQPTWGV